jgi:hypothetical protein
MECGLPIPRDHYPVYRMIVVFSVIQGHDDFRFNFLYRWKDGALGQLRLAVLTIDAVKITDFLILRQ